MYLAEWHDAYPPNCPLRSNGKPGCITARVKLSQPRPLRTGSAIVRYQYGVNWVEALNPYMEAVSPDRSGSWVCPIVGGDTYPENSRTARVSYVFNRNLVEGANASSAYPCKTMMVRETDRLLDAELRPTNYSCGRPDVEPDSPFLTDHDSRIGDTNPDLHARRSNILFADGHVKTYGTKQLSRKPIWDQKRRQWLLRVPDSEWSHTVAITP
jgi:prepilin-type processing-associated H-X9-DG protein